MGVKFEFEINIEKINLKNKEISGIETDRGELTSDKYLVTLGSYSPQLLNPIGINIPIYPVKGYSVTLPIVNEEDAPQSTLWMRHIRLP